MHEPGDAGDRQRLAGGIVAAMTVGVALALAVGSWSMLVVGVTLSIVLWAHSGGGSG
jgi:hypothetical protein